MEVDWTCGAMNGINKNKEECCQQQANKQANKQHHLTQTKDTTLDCEKTYWKS